jgi:2'-5' RNA ligase
MRAFIAIDLPDGFQRVAAQTGAVIRDEDRSWRSDRWVEPQNLHVTLKFLGELHEDAVAGIADVLAEASAAIRPFALVPHEVRAVPNGHATRLLWVAFRDPDGECGLLATAAERAAMAAGVAPDTRVFRPHATLVRARTPHAVKPRALAAASRQITCEHKPVSVVAATIFSSELTPHGPIYQEVHRCTLGNG